MQRAFFSLEEQVKLRHLRNSAMLSQALGVDEIVVYVDEDKSLEKLPENLMHKVLQYEGGVDQSIYGMSRYS